MATLREDIERFPTLTFWYGIGYNELMEMPNWALRLYAEALPGLLAEYQALHLTASAYPYMTKEGQRGVQRRLRQNIRERGEDRRRKLTRTALRARMKSLGFGWEDVSKKKKTEESE